MILPRRLAVSVLVLIVFPVMYMVSSSIELSEQNKVSHRSWPIGRGENRLTGGVAFSGSFTGAAPWKVTMLTVGRHSPVGRSGSLRAVSALNDLGVRLSGSPARDNSDESASAFGDETVGSIPEPNPLTLLATGAVGIFADGLRRRNRRTRARPEATPRCNL